MGWASRARQSAAQVELKMYVVRRWTAFEWSFADDDERKDRSDHLKRSAGTFERQLRRKFPSMEATVRQVKVKKDPQLLFELVLPAVDEHDAIRRARYRIDRALSTRVPTGRALPRPEKIALRPPWGKEQVSEGRGAKRRVTA